MIPFSPRRKLKPNGTERLNKGLARGCEAGPRDTRAYTLNHCILLPLTPEASWGEHDWRRSGGHTCHTPDLEHHGMACLKGNDK